VKNHRHCFCKKLLTIRNIWYNGGSFDLSAIEEIPMASATRTDSLDIQSTYGKFFEYSREGIIISGKDGRILRANPAAARILGYKDPKEMKGMETIDLYQDHEERIHVFKKLNMDGHVDNLSLIFLKKDGEHIHCFGSAIATKDKKGTITRVEGIFTDVTETKHMENELKVLHSELEQKVKERTVQIQKKNKALLEEIKKRKQKENEFKASEEKFKLLFQLAPDGILLMDLDGRILSRNKAASQMGGFTDKEIIGKRFHETPIFSEKQAEAYKKIYELFLRGIIKPPLEFEYVTKSNEKRIAEAHFSLLQEKGRFLGILAIVRDVTEKKKAVVAIQINKDKLKEQNQLLEEKNIALREVMTQIKEEKDRLTKQVQSNFDKLAFPIIERLKLRCKNDEDHQFVSLLENNLKNIISPFGQEITKETLSLTPKEIEICNMIAGGMSSKEIGKLLTVSFRTIETHRNNIRKKLRIQNEQVNLNSYLKQMKFTPANNT